MRQREHTHIVPIATALTVTAVVLALLILATGADLATVATFAGLVALGASVVWAVQSWSGRSGDDAELQSERATVHESAVQEVVPVASVPGSAVISVPSRPQRTVVHTAAEGVAAIGRDIASMADVIGSSLWVEDPPTATLRLLASAGRMPPSDTPISCEDDPVGQAVLEGSPVVIEVAGVTTHDSEHVMVRTVLPLLAGEVLGCLLLDVLESRSDDPSRRDEVLDAVSGWGSAMSGTLAIEVARLETTVAREITEAARDLSRCIEPGSVLEKALDRAMGMSSAATGSIMLLQPGDTLKIAVSRGLPSEVADVEGIAPADGIAGWVLSTGQPLLVEDLPGGKGAGRRHGIRSAVSVPLSDETGTIGVMNVGSKLFPARFTRSHMAAVETVARQACVAYRNAIAVDSARELYLSAVKALAIAMETKDPYSRGGTDRIVDHVVALGKALSLSDEEMGSLKMAALLHDLGMTAAGTGAVSEDRPLTTMEHGLLKMHPVIAADLIAEAPMLSGVTPIVYHHHERYDGKGYVGGLSGQEIPVGARVLAVVDAYVAMTSRRPYRDAMTHEEAVMELLDNRDTQFDAHIVDTFIDTLGERRLSGDRDMA